MWPVFVVVTFLDGLVLDLLTPIRVRAALIAGILIATFVNLFLIGALAPWLAKRMRARRPAEPGAGAAPPQAALEVLTDRIGTGLLLAGLAGVLVAGLAARPVVVGETEDKEENARIVRRLVLESGNRELISNLESANTVRLGEGYFRTCVARRQRERYFCVFVDTTREPTRVTRDPSAEPNSTFRSAP